MRAGAGVGQNKLHQLPRSRDLNPLQITHMEYEDPDQLQKTEETQASSNHMKYQTISRGKMSMSAHREQQGAYIVFNRHLQDVYLRSR